MKKEVNQSKKVEDVTRNYEHPYFVRIEDGDEASIKYYKGQDVPVAHIAFNGCKNITMQYLMRKHKRKLI